MLYGSGFSVPPEHTDNDTNILKQEGFLDPDVYSAHAEVQNAEHDEFP